MGKLVTPQVYFVGETAILSAGMCSYLTDSGNEDFLDAIDAARQGGLTDGEILCSFYAKLCYKSLTLGQNKNITRTRDISDNLRGCFDQGHSSVFEHCQLNFVVRDCSRVLTHELVRHRAGTAFCLAGDTQVWSGSRQNGRWNGVKKKWSLKQLHDWSCDPERRSRVGLVSVRTWDGDKFVATRVRRVFASGVKKLVKITLEDGKSIRCSVDHRFVRNESGSERWRTVTELTIGDLLATNGQLLHQSQEWLRTQYVDLGRCQNTMAAEAGVSRHTIRKWLRIHGLTDPIRSRGHRFQPGSMPWNSGISGYKLGNIIPPEECRRRSTRMTGAGNHRWKGDAAPKQAGRLRCIRLHPTMPCTECGAPEGHRHHKDRNTHNNAASNIEFLCGSCHGKRHLIEDGPRNVLTVRWLKIEAIEPSGEEMTYDLEVDHPAHNFVANGFVTHNSQTSGRFVRGDSVDVVFDPILEPVRDIVEQMQADDETRYREMVQRFDLDNMTDFNRKKQITSALRRLLPNGQSNEIGFSCNLRTLRHTVMVRTSRHAEWEIRHVFNQIYTLVKAKYPLVFHGAQEEVVDDLLEVSGMKMQPWEKSSS